MLERSVPSANQSLSSSPTRIELWFTERIDHGLTTVRLLSASGEEIPLGKIEGGDDPYYAFVSVPETLGPGIYTVVYDNLSRDDGHRWQGFFPFVVLNPDGSQPAITQLPSDLAGEGRTSQLPGVVDVVLKWAGLIAAVIIVGASVAHLVVVRPATEYLSKEAAEDIEGRSGSVLLRWTQIASVVLFVSAVGQLLLLVDRLGGLSRLSDIVLETRPGTLWLIRIGLAVAIAAVALGAARTTLRAPAWSIAALLLALSLGVIAAYSLASHAAASATGGEATAIASDFIHFVATGLWLGVLVQLLVLWRPVRSGLDERDRLILSANLFDRFSALAVVSVFVLLLTGVFSAFVQIPEWTALWETTYGIVLLVKLALVLPLLGIAGVNARFLKPALVAAIDSGYADDAQVAAEPTPQRERIEYLRARLTKSMILEVGLGVLVLASVAILTQTGTSRGEIAQEQAQERSAQALAAREHETYVFNANKLAGDLAVAFRVNPNLVGLNTFEVRLNSAERQEIGEVEQVSVRFFYNDPAFGSTNAISAELDQEAPTGELVYKLEGAYFSISGGYRVQVDVRRPGMDDMRAIFPLQVGKAPEPKRDSFDFPFYAGTKQTTASIILLVIALGLFLGRSHLGFLAPWARPAGELLAIGVFAGSAVLALSAVISPPDEASGNPVPLTAESVERGKILFARNCAMCHGNTGRGDGPAGANLNPPPADFLIHVPYHGDSSLFGWISNGVQGTGMPAFADELSEQERWDLVNFLRKTFADEGSPIENPFDLQDADRTPVPTTTPSP